MFSLIASTIKLYTSPHNILGVRRISTISGECIGRICCATWTSTYRLWTTRRRCVCWPWISSTSSYSNSSYTDTSWTSPPSSYPISGLRSDSTDRWTHPEWPDPDCCSRRSTRLPETGCSSGQSSYRRRCLGDRTRCRRIGGLPLTDWPFRSSGTSVGRRQTPENSGIPDTSYSCRRTGR